MGQVRGGEEAPSFAARAQRLVQIAVVGRRLVVRSDDAAPHASTCSRAESSKLRQCVSGRWGMLVRRRAAAAVGSAAACTQRRAGLHAHRISRAHAKPPQPRLGHSINLFPTICSAQKRARLSSSQPLSHAHAPLNPQRIHQHPAPLTLHATLQPPGIMSGSGFLHCVQACSFERGTGRAAGLMRATFVLASSSASAASDPKKISGTGTGNT